MNRAQRKRLAEETLIILQNGFYTVENKKIDIGYEQSEAVQKTKYYESEQLDAIVANTKAENFIDRDVEAVESNSATFSGVEAKDVLEIIDLLSSQDKNLIKQRLIEDLADSET